MFGMLKSGIALLNVLSITRGGRQLFNSAFCNDKMLFKSQRSSFQNHTPFYFASKNRLA